MVAMVAMVAMVGSVLDHFNRYDNDLLFDLVVNYQRFPSEEKFERILFECRGIIFLSIKRSGFCGILEKSEMVSVCNGVIFKSVESFDPKFGVKFSTFIFKSLKYGLMRLYRSNINFSLPNDKLGAFRRALLGHKDYYDYSKEGIREIPEKIILLANYFETSEDYDFDEIELPEEFSIEDLVILKSLKKKLLSLLNDYDFEILFRMVFLGQTGRQIAPLFNLSHAAIHNRFNFILARLRVVAESWQMG